MDTYVHSGPQTPDLRYNPVRCQCREAAADVAEVRPCVAEVSRRDILDYLIRAYLEYAWRVTRD